jgi:hypothetical protein
MHAYHFQHHDEQHMCVMCAGGRGQPVGAVQALPHTPLRPGLGSLPGLRPSLLLSGQQHSSKCLKKLVMVGCGDRGVQQYDFFDDMAANTNSTSTTSHTTAAASDQGECSTRAHKQKCDAACIPCACNHKPAASIPPGAACILCVVAVCLQQTACQLAVLPAVCPVCW